MSIMTVPFVADVTAYVMGGLSSLAPAPRGRFPEIPSDKQRVVVPTRHGEVRCILYRPPGGTEARPPVYVNAHGGGFVVRYPEQDDALCRYLAARAGVVVVSVDYHTAPRHRFPVPVEELFDVVRWASEAERPWDGSRLCVGGQSAGGSLAAAVARLALEGGGPRVALQVLHYAALDLVLTPPEWRPDSSRRVLPVWMAEMFHTAYLPDLERRKDPLASPAWGVNGDGIEGIAPALVITAERDPLRDSAEAYARKLERAGSLAELREVPGADHGYDILGGDGPRTRAMYDVIVGHVRRATEAATGTAAATAPRRTPRR